MTKAKLRTLVNARGSHFFDRASMRFFGDTMTNYGLRTYTRQTPSTDFVGVDRPIHFTTPQTVVHELYRKTPVNGGLRTSTYFNDAGEVVRVDQSRTV